MSCAFSQPEDKRTPGCQMVQGKYVKNVTLELQQLAPIQIQIREQGNLIWCKGTIPRMQPLTSDTNEKGKKCFQTSQFAS